MFARSLAPLLVVLPFIALAGAIVMTLPQALAFTLAPPGSAARRPGCSTSRAASASCSGRSSSALRDRAVPRLAAATDGYAAMWPVVGIPVLLAGVLMKPLEEGRAEPVLQRDPLRRYGVATATCWWTSQTSSGSSERTSN